jgi:ribosomal peptide maturation radical SAM protein 1
MAAATTTVASQSMRASSEPARRPAVVLVAPPFLALTRPALGVSTLQPALVARGIETQILYLNLRFAECIGPDLFQFVAEQAQTSLLIGEWVFADGVAVAPDPCVETDYLDRIRSYCGVEWPRIVAARKTAKAFVEAAARELAAMEPRLIGFSTTFQQNCASLAIARRLKELAPGIAVCFGGANCDGEMGVALFEQFDQIDFVFRGEADRSFPEFVQHFLDGHMPYSTDPQVLGRCGVSSGAVVQPLSDLDSLPVPDFTDYFSALDRSSFADRVVAALPFESSRGCWWGQKHHCTFCGLNGGTMSFRTKSADRVIVELDTLYQRWQVARFEAADNIMDMRHIEGVFGQLAARGDPAYRLLYEIKSNMRPSQLETIARGGVTWVQPGIENLDNHVLALMQKGVTGLQNVRLLRTCCELGLRPLWNVLWGFPGESASAYRRIVEWLPLLEHLQPPTGQCRIRLDRFSPYFERAATFGFRNVEPAFAYRAVYNLPSSILRRLAYFFDGVAPQSASEEDIAPLKAAIAAWQRAYAEPDGIPLATIVRLGPIAIVKDTRRIATDKWHILDDVELGVLDAFRDPAQIDRAVIELGTSGIPEECTRKSLDELIERGLIMIDGSTALTLVTDAGKMVIDDTRRADFPGGWLRPLQEENRNRARVSSSM